MIIFNTEDGKTTVLGTCDRCGTPEILPVTLEQIRRWKSVSLIQNAMPNLTAAQREMFLSGTCGACWNQLFENGEGEDDESEGLHA